MSAVLVAAELPSSLCHSPLSMQEEDGWLPFLSVSGSEVSAGPLPRGGVRERKFLRKKKK